MCTKDENVFQKLRQKMAEDKYLADALATATLEPKAPPAAWRCELELPIRTQSEANVREHWAAKARRVKNQRKAVALYWRTRLDCRRLAAEFGLFRHLRAVVTLTRVAPRVLDGHDALPGSFKAVVDQIADELGLKSDYGPRIGFVYAQAKGKPKEYAVRIAIDLVDTERAMLESMP